MRKFWSYGSPLKTSHYYVSRQELVDRAILKLIGENPDEGGHYITIWAPRQRGKTWIMEEVMFTLRDHSAYEAFDVVHIPLEDLKLKKSVEAIIEDITHQILERLGRSDLINQHLFFRDVFKRGVLSKPLILILDEFDALLLEAISGIVSAFRNIHFLRRQQADKPSAERDYLLHGVALIGVRAVLGIENKTGSPFNVQHSLHIPNFTFDEVESMFKWYERDSGQTVEPAVIKKVFDETQGQPGLIGWLGELLTETYNKHNPSITLRDFDIAYSAAVNALPNANVINIVSKAKQEPHRRLLLELLETNQKMEFRFDDPDTNFLYMNGVIELEVENETNRYIKFPSPFIQKRLFNYFAYELFGQGSQLYPPFTDLSQAISETSLNIKNILKLHEAYIQANKHWLMKDAPRRKDLRVYEAVYHFNLYLYLNRFIRRRGGDVWPEFPTGNGQVDLMIRYAGQEYALEVKSFVDDYEYHKGLNQAARYGHKLGLTTVTLVMFVEAVDETSRKTYEVPYTHSETGVLVEPLFVITV
ncbi:AAA-like domain-containing protein [Anaerolineales bacterium HSG6]|nr:AAA-like domain-containing protein [Anaerolineales bacterium HSG6]